MARSLAELMADVRGDTGNPPIEVVTADEIIRRINDAYIEIASPSVARHNRLKKDTTITTAADTSEYGLPARYWHMRVVKDETNEQRLVYRRLEWIEEQHQTDETGTPDFWTIEDEHIRFYPTPDGAYTVRIWYIERPAPLVDLQDTTTLDEEWDEPIKLGAVQRVFYLLGEHDRQVHALNLQRRLMGNILDPESYDMQTGTENTGPVNSWTETN